VCGLTGLIIGIPSLIVTFIPCCGWFALPGVITSLVLGIIGMVLAKGSSGRMGGGLAVASLVLGAIGILVSIVWLVFFSVASTLPTTPGVTLTTPADVTVTAVELDRDYNQNVAAADAKYKDKVVEVTGVVERVTDELRSLRTTVELTGSPDSDATVDCDFRSSEKASLATVQTGSTVTIRGKCVGRRTVEGSKYVTLEDCVVVPAGSKTPDKPGDGAVKVTADTLTKEFADNLTAAEAKYDGKMLQVSGKVAFVTPDRQGYTVVTLGTGTTVECWVVGTDAAGKALKVGEQATLRGKCESGGGFGPVSLKDATVVK
jgi:hypothetical protein